tara:strand:+ start:4769 stop:6016 length:1248 start_codon:yes stop_codon:yes gene_type:complete
MKFLLVTNNDFDGVGQPAINLCINLNAKGHESKVLVLHKSTNHKFVEKIKRSLFSRIILFLLNFIKKSYSELFGFGYATVSYKNLKPHIDKADIVIIFTFYKIISNKVLSKILSNKKNVYFRPLDIELASGGCHFNRECENFTLNCEQCPKLYFNKIINLPSENLKEKKRIFEKYRPKIFVQNNYVGKVFKKSSIFKNLETQPIFLGANSQRNKLISKKIAREALNIDENERIILFGAFNLASQVKGGHLLKESLKILESKIKKNITNPVRLLTIGNKNTFVYDSTQIKWTHLGLVSSNEKLNLIYRAADVLVCPSLYCFGPHIVTEALLNDLPVVAYNLGVAQDTVINGKNGYLVPCFDNNIFADSIYKVLFNEKITIKDPSVDRIKKFCSSEFETNTFIEVAQADLMISNKFT